jgi:hypothetical protein
MPRRDIYRVWLVRHFQTVSSLGQLDLSTSGLFSPSLTLVT